MTQMRDPDYVEEREHIREVRHGEIGYRERIEEDVNEEQRIMVVRFTQMIWLLFGILEALIALRVILKLIAANPGNPFASLVYNITDLFVWPFLGLTVTPEAGGMVLEIHSIIAMIVYAILGWVLVKLSWILLYNPTTRRVTTYEHRHED